MGAKKTQKNSNIFNITVGSFSSECLPITEHAAEFVCLWCQLAVYFCLLASLSGCTPMSLAASRGHLPVIQVLIDYGASPNIANCYGQLPIHCAARKGHVDIVQFFVLDQNVHPDVATGEGKEMCVNKRRVLSPAAMDDPVEGLLLTPFSVSIQTIYIYKVTLFFVVESEILLSLICSTSMHLVLP